MKEERYGNLSLIGKITEQLEKKNSQGVNIGKSQDGGNVISRGDG
jgi:hypothetical protein